MSDFGKLIILELYDCGEKLKDNKFIENLLKEIIRIGNFHLINIFSKELNAEQSYTALLLEEGNINFYNSFVDKYVIVNIFYYEENIKIENLLLYIAVNLEAKKYSCNEIKFGENIKK